MTDLKSKSISRILTDMISKTIGKKNPNVILVLDDYSSIILSEFLTISDLLSQNLLSVERIESKRKHFPFEAIYFISPSESSCRKLVEDFEEPENPTYTCAHIFFTHKVPGDCLSILTDENLLKRTITCKELNLSFYLRDLNQFDLNENENLFIFAEKLKKYQYLTKIVERLATVCATLNNYPNIQYQVSSDLCEYVAKELNEQLESIFNNDKSKKSGILLITDRTIDLVSPLLHDYSYQSIIFGYYKGNKPNEIDLSSIKNYIKNNKDISLGTDINKIQNFLILNDEDIIYSKYKNDEISSMSLNVEKEIKLCKNLRDEINKDKTRIIEEVQIDQKVGVVKMHYYLCNHITNNNTDVEKSINLIPLEEEIVTGVDGRGKDVNYSTIIQKYESLEESSKFSISEKKRILGIIYACFNIKNTGDPKSNEFKLLCDKNGVKQEEFKNFQYLSKEKNESSKETKRIFSLENIINVPSRLIKNDVSEVAYIPKLVSIVDKACCLKLEEEFKFVEDPVNLPKSNKNFVGKKNDKQNFILFNIGGISYIELSMLDKLEKEKNFNYKFIIGSTGVYNASEYLEQVKSMKK